MRSSDFSYIVAPNGVHGRDSTRMKTITGGAAQANKILADFKGSKPRARMAKGGPVIGGCGCGGTPHK